MTVKPHHPLPNGLTPEKLLPKLLTRLAEGLSDAQIARIMETDGRNIRRWRDGTHTPRNIWQIIYLCLGIAVDRGLVPTPDINTDIC